MDSMPGLSTGTLEMSGPQSGNYDECLNIESPDEEEKPKIYGQYCGLNIESYINFNPNGITPELIDLINNYNQTSNTFGNLRLITEDMDMKSFKLNFPDIRSLFEIINDYKESSKHLIGFCLPLNCNPKDISRVLTDCKENI